MATSSQSLDVPTPSVVSPPVPVSGPSLRRPLPPPSVVSPPVPVPPQSPWQRVPPPPQFRPVPRPQVFVNFRGDELRTGFVSHLVKALEVAGVNVFIDSKEVKGRDLKYLFKRIEKSKMAIVIFSDRYSESDWCLDEVEKMDERLKEKKLRVIPVFYKISTEDVKYFKGSFGSFFEDLVKKGNESKADGWRSSVKCITSKTGFVSVSYRTDSDLVDAIVEEMKKQLPQIPKETKLSTEQEILVSLMFAGLFTLLSNFIKPYVLIDLSFYKTAQWFVGVLCVVILKKMLF